MIKIGKYKFNSKEQAIEKIDGLGIAQDEDGNNYPTHKHTVVELGYELISEAVIDEEGEIVEEAVYSEKYLVDVLWNGLEEDEDGDIDHPYGWKTYALDLDHEGVHGFLGVSYLGNKL